MLTSIAALAPILVAQTRAAEARAAPTTFADHAHAAHESMRASPARRRGNCVGQPQGRQLLRRLIRRTKGQRLSRSSCGSADSSRSAGEASVAARARVVVAATARIDLDAGKDMLAANIAVVCRGAVSLQGVPGRTAPLGQVLRVGMPGAGPTGVTPTAPSANTTAGSVLHFFKLGEDAGLT